MIRTTRKVNECVCENCYIIQLLGETFNGHRCCDNPLPRIIGSRIVVDYTKTNEEEKQEVIDDMNR